MNTNIKEDFQISISASLTFFSREHKHSIDKNFHYFKDIFIFFNLANKLIKNTLLNHLKSIEMM